MSEENNNAKMAEPESTANDSQKLTEDARGLGPRQTGPFAIGLVDMIVGEGGLEVPGLVPTKYETLLLVRAWAGEILDRDFGFFLYGSVGSSEWRTREYANRRLNTIAKSIGEEEVKRAFKQAEQEFAKGVDQRAWKIFMEGTKEEQESFQQEVQEKLAGDTATDRHKPPEPTKYPYSQQTLQRAYQMYEQGSTHVSVMKETGLNRKTARWISFRQLAGLGIPAVKPVTIVDTEFEDSSELATWLNSRAATRVSPQQVLSTDKEITGVNMKVALKIPEEVAIALVDDSYAGDPYERVDEVEGDFMDGAIVGNQLIFLCRGKVYRFYFADFGTGSVEVTDSPDKMVNCEEVQAVAKEIPARTECRYVPV